MAMYAFNYTDLEPGSPRVPPHPLIACAIYTSGMDQLTDEVRDALADLGPFENVSMSRWYVSIWDTSKGDLEVAKAAFVWTGKAVVMRNLYVEASYQSLSLDKYLIEIGSGLFGGRSVEVLPVRDQGHGNESGEPT